MPSFTIGSILFALAILIVLGLFLVGPFFRAQARREARVSQQQQILARKDALLDLIRALEFDHDTGKVPDLEYEQQRAALMSEAAAALKALDELPGGPAGEEIYAQIEAAVSRIKQQRADRSGTPARFCTNCGQPLDADDNFCARCGQPVYAIQTSA